MAYKNFFVTTDYFFKNNIVDVVVFESEEEIADIVEEVAPGETRKIGGLFVNSDLDIDKMDGANLGTIYLVEGDYLCLEVIVHECSHVINVLFSIFVELYEKELENSPLLTDAIPRLKGKDWDNLDELIAHATGRLISDICRSLHEHHYPIKLYTGYNDPVL